MNVSVFGLGYVGAVAAGCLAHDGHNVTAVDVSADKVDLVNRGVSPIIEQGVDRLIADAVAQGSLRASSDAFDAVGATDVSLVCVGTPSRSNGSTDLGAVRRVAEQIGAAIARKGRAHIVVLRSTVPPGTTREIVAPLITAPTAGLDGCSVLFNPEFLREGSAISDYYDPAYTLMGADGEFPEQVIRELYAKVPAPLLRTDTATAEMLKYAANAFHATKITFANEIGMIAAESGADGRAVMDLLCRDSKLNISTRYLTPGFAYGGSCLPKDVRSLVFQARDRDVDTPLLAALNLSNTLQVERAVRTVLAMRRRKVALIGISFKPGTDDLRESPMVVLAERLLGKGLELAIFDENVSLARLVGANKRYIETEIPHLSSLLAPTVDDAMRGAEVIVVAHRSPTLESQVSAALVPEQSIIDLAGCPALQDVGAERYHAIAW